MDDLKKRDLDCQVAEKVMGWKIKGKDSDWRWWGIPPGWTGPESVQIPHYSTTIAASWEVVQKILSIEKEKKTYLPVFLVQVASDGCSAVLQVGMGCQKVIENASTVPLAICRAALKAVENVNPGGSS